MFTEDDPRVVQLVENNQKALVESLETLIKRIMDPEIMDAIPEELR